MQIFGKLRYNFLKLLDVLFAAVEFELELVSPVTLCSKVLV